MAAFRATLEEIEEADGILHVIDITHQNAPEQVQVVDDLLAGLNLEGKPRILVLNKIDLLMDQAQVEAYARRLKPEFDDERAVTVSAARGWGLDHLLETIEELLAHRRGQASNAPGFWVNHRYDGKARS